MANIGTTFRIDASALDAVVKVTCIAPCKHNMVHKGYGCDASFSCDFKNISINEDGVCRNFEKAG